MQEARLNTAATKSLSELRAICDVLAFV
jgi:hypothetical protein